MNDQITTLKEFKIRNRVNVNRYLNYVLWFFAVAAPAIAIGVRAGIFRDISYATCVSTFVLVVILSSIHLIMYRKIPSSIVTGIFALTAVDILLAYMSISHVSIYLTWFIVPLLSLLFCDFSIFGYAAITNVILMVIATVQTAPYYVMRTDYADTGAYLADRLGGYAIETTVMLASGFIVLKLAVGYLSRVFGQNAIIMQQKQQMREKMDILSSMAEIYDNVNLINFSDSTEMSLRDEDQVKHEIDLDTQSHTLMNQKIKKQIMPDQLDEFLEFTNIKTLRDRLKNKKLISADFTDVVSGWFRAQYITVDLAPDGTPDTVIYTTRNVDEEKRREEQLIRISMTDGLTRLHNRRRYEEDLNAYRMGELPDDLVLFSVDVNGLKKVNDTKGHAAGDELIKGAAECLVLSVGNKGRVYRTGGDEFMAVVHTTEPENIRSSIIEKGALWQGEHVDEVAMSVGYAAKKDFYVATIDELEHIADADMYSEKERFYKERGIERR